MLQKHRFGRGNVQNRLAGFGVPEEDHEINGMPATQSDTHLAVGFEAANAGTMAGARVNDQKGPESIIARHHVLGWGDADQGVIHRALQLAAIHHGFIVKNQHRRAAGLFVGDEVIARFAHRIPEKKAALCRIQHVGSGIHRQILRRLHQPLTGLAQAFQRCLRVQRIRQGAGVATHHIRHDAGLFQHALGGRIALAQQFPTGGDGALGCHGIGSYSGVFLRL